MALWEYQFIFFELLRHKKYELSKSLPLKNNGKQCTNYIIFALFFVGQ